MRCALALAAALLLASAGSAAASKISDAETAFADGDDQAALRLYTEALADPALTPDGRAAALIGRGEVQVLLRNSQAAIDDFTAAIAASQDPRTKASVHFSRAESLTRLRRDEEAIADYTECLKLAPDFIGAHIARANIYRRLDRKEEALADYEAELKRHPTDSRALVARAEMLGLPIPVFDFHVPD